MPQSTEQSLVVTRDGGVATLWLNRPEKRNAVSYDMWLRLGELAEALAADASVRVLVVRGTGEHFCAGGDIGGLGDLPFEEYRRANERADRALAAFPKPSIAFVAGSCVGGGAEIAIACDLRIADTTARFGITPARLGIVYPGFAVARAVQLIGESATKHLLFTAEIIDAERALRIGLVDELLAPDDAERRLTELVGVISRERSLLTQMASKEMVDSVLAHGVVTDDVETRWDAALATSSDAAEGITSFLERRAPRFTWTPEAGEPAARPAVPLPVSAPVLGVDACRGGWVGALLAPGLPRPQVIVAPTIAELVETANASMRICVVAIDIPIGLPDTTTRAADGLARREVPGRGSTVYPALTRAAYQARDRTEADMLHRARTGKGVSAQAFGLAAKVLDVDAWLRTRPVMRVVEAHPEMCFARMAGAPIAAGKKTPEGVAARLEQLAAAGIARPSLLQAPEYAADDVLDACALAWTAARVAAGDACCLPDPPEVFSDGIPAAIWV
jgi:enoyl-CoA hydratase/carnithine racemase/predicted RNase H-like nuclease